MDDNRRKLFVGGLPSTTTSGHVQTYFQSFGELATVNIRFNPAGQCQGFGFVEMLHRDSVDRVLAACPHFLMGQRVDVKAFVKLPVNCKVFVGGLGSQTTNESLRQYFSQFGALLDGSIRVDTNTGRPRGFAIITFADESSVDACVSSKEHLVDGKVVEVKRADKDGSQRGGGGGGGARMTQGGSAEPSSHNNANNLFVGGISRDTTKETMEAFYSQFGQLENIHVATDKISGNKRGFGYVKFADAEATTRCLQSRPHVLDGKTVETKRVLPRDDPKNVFTVTKLFVGGLKREHNEENLREYFSRFGNVNGVQLKQRSDGGPGHAGFAFVTFDDSDSVDQVILHGSHMVANSRVDCHKGLNKDEMAKLQLQTERDRLAREQRSAGAATSMYANYSNTLSSYQQQPMNGSMPSYAGGYGGGHAVVSVSNSAQTAMVPAYSSLPTGVSGGLQQIQPLQQPMVIKSEQIGMSDYTGKAAAQFKTANHIRGDAFRQLLLSTECSQTAISTLQNENLLDSAVLLSLTPAEFDNLPLAIGDKKRIEIALRTLNNA